MGSAHIVSLLAPSLSRNTRFTTSKEVFLSLQPGPQRRAWDHLQKLNININSSTRAVVGSHPCFCFLPNTFDLVIFPVLADS